MNEFIQGGKGSSQLGWGGWEASVDTKALEQLLDSSWLSPHARILDLGCGGGETAVLMAERGFRVTAMDFAPTALELARTRARDAGVMVDFQLRDMRAIDAFEDHRFDCVVDHRAFHCLVVPVERRAVLSEVARVLSPGGVFWSSTIAGMPRQGSELVDLVDPITRANRAGTRYFADAKDYLEMLRATGFKIVDHCTVGASFVVDNLNVTATTA